MKTLVSIFVILFSIQAQSVSLFKDDGCQVLRNEYTAAAGLAEARERAIKEAETEDEKAELRKGLVDLQRAAFVALGALSQCERMPKR